MADWMDTLRRTTPMSPEARAQQERTTQAVQDGVFYGKIGADIARGAQYDLADVMSAKAQVDFMREFLK